MPVMNEWEKSFKITNELRNDVVTASVKFCFLPLSGIFEELYITLAWDLYFEQTPKDVFSLYSENESMIEHLIQKSDLFSITGMGNMLLFSPRQHITVPLFPYSLPVLKEGRGSYGSHALSAPVEGTNKKERKLYKRYTQLQKDLKVFNRRISAFKLDLGKALDSCTTTKQFNTQNPEFEGYMKQSLKKFYNDKHPNVINSLNSAMDVRTYASITSGHRLQAYQVSMLAQLEQLELRHIPLSTDPAQV